MKQYIFYSQNTPMNCYIWNNVEKPVGVVQIIRDNYEKLSQYDKLAQFLNKNGYIVFGKYQDIKDANLNLNQEIEIFNFLKHKFYLPIFLIANNNSICTAKNIIQNVPNCSGTCIIQSQMRLKNKIASLFQNRFNVGAEICTKTPVLIIDKTKKINSINTELIHNIKERYKHCFLKPLQIVLYSSAASDSEYNYLQNDVLKFFNNKK